MTIQSQSQSRKQRLSLFSERGEVAPDAAKVQGATPTAKTAGDLLLDFEHANIALSLRVVERHTQIVQKGQDRILMPGQPVEQIASGALFASSAPLWFVL